jgi:hypothetical protein
VDAPLTLPESGDELPPRCSTLRPEYCIPQFYQNALPNSTTIFLARIRRKPELKRCRSRCRRIEKWPLPTPICRDTT